MRRLLVLLALVGSLIVAAPAPAGAATVERRAGADRYATAVEVSRASASPGVATVFVASGTTFADALSAAPVAGAARAPILLVPRTSVPAVVAGELDRLRPGRIVVLGGTSAVSDDVVRRLARHTTGEVVRRSGPDRFSTSAAISQEGFAPGVRVAFVTSGQSAPDALAAGAPATGTGPVLLVTRADVPGPVARELTRLRPQAIVIVGGTSAVSDAVAAQLEDFTTGPVSRRAGADRFTTSAEASRGGITAPAADVYLASGRTTADALAGGWAAGAARGPVLLTERACVPDAVLREIERLQPQRIVLLGGSAVLTDGVGRLTPCRLGATVIATGLQVPWEVAFAPGGRVFVTERRTGRVLERQADGRFREVHRLPSQDLGEGGLLGLAASPRFADDGLLYAYFTSSTDNRVVRFRPGDPASTRTVLSGIPRASNHDGGRIAFGPDGMLWVTTGDAGVPQRSQDPTSLAGKLLRLRPDGGVPADNPRPGSPVYALGLRNPQGITWDAQGRGYLSEIGPDRDDEVNRVVRNGNYGWPVVTGTAGDPRFVDPIVVRQPAVASWSGATVIRGGIPEWDGDLLVAALRGRRLHRVDLRSDGSVAGVEELYTGTYGRLRHAVQAPDGAVWLLTSNRDGRADPGPDDDRIIRIGHPT